jgi:hypothetical protein
MCKQNYKRSRLYKKKYLSSKDATTNEESDTAVFNKVA